MSPEWVYKEHSLSFTINKWKGRHWRITNHLHYLGFGGIKQSQMTSQSPITVDRKHSGTHVHFLLSEYSFVEPLFYIRGEKPGHADRESLETKEKRKQNQIHCFWVSSEPRNTDDANKRPTVPLLCWAIWSIFFFSLPFWETKNVKQQSTQHTNDCLCRLAWCQRICLVGILPLKHSVFWLRSSIRRKKQKQIKKQPMKKSYLHHDIQKWCVHFD